MRVSIPAGLYGDCRRLSQNLYGSSLGSSRTDKYRSLILNVTRHNC